MEGEKFNIRMLYQHSRGKVFYAIGLAKDENKKTVVIMSDTSDGEVYTRPIELFIGDNATYTLVTPAK